MPKVSLGILTGRKVSEIPTKKLEPTRPYSTSIQASRIHCLANRKNAYNATKETAHHNLGQVRINDFIKLSKDSSMSPTLRNNAT